MSSLNFITLAVVTLVQLHTCLAGCSGVKDLPLVLGSPSTHVVTGAKSYTEKTVHALAARLVADIPGLTMTYARVMAEDALNIEENFEITYRFFISSGTARISQFKIKSTTLHNKNVNINWNILNAVVTYTAQTQITVHARRRRRWIGGGRRRCANEKRPRGITKSEISKLQSTLTSVMNRVGEKSPVFVLKRVTTAKQATGSCAAWNRNINMELSRSCSKRAGKVPAPYPNPPIRNRRPIRPVERTRRPLRRGEHEP